LFACKISNLIQHPVKNAVFCKGEKSDKTNKMVANFENEYKEVINEIEGHSKQLTAVHSKHLH